jgi:GBP family porin
MKKTWVALAVAGAFVAGTAQAQSSVTLYGILDVNYMWEEKPTCFPSGVSGTCPAGTTDVRQESLSAINSGHQSGNRWGLRGSEDLGGGMKAIFALESGFDLDRGTMGQGGRLFGRQAWAGISTNMGAVVAGRLASFSSGTGSFDMFGRTDPFLTGFGLASLGNTFYSANALRVDNAIAYQSPKWAGFQGGIGYSFNVNGAETAPNGSNTSALISAVTWEAGPFWVSVTYDAVSFADDTRRPDQKHLQVGATFDLGPVRLHGGYANQSNISGVGLVSGGSGAFIPLPSQLPSYDNNSYMAGVTWKLGAFTLLGSYQWSGADGQSYTTIAGGPTLNFDPDYSVFGIGATYNLSRRTNLYASYAARNADGTLLDNRFNYKQLALGVRHLF